MFSVYKLFTSLVKFIPRFFFSFCLVLLVGIQNGSVTMENSVEIPQNLKIELPYNTEKNSRTDAIVK